MTEARDCPDDGNTYIIAGMSNDDAWVNISDIFGGHQATIPKQEWVTWEINPYYKEGELDGS